MRKILFLIIMALGIGCCVMACSRAEDMPKTTIKVYYVDAELNRLLPYDEEIIDSDTQHMAEAVVAAIIKGRDYNEQIRRIIPNRKNCVTVRTQDNTAYVNLDSYIKKTIPDSRDIERLLIYQLVNSLTELKGIRFVKFTIDGEIHKDFMGYYDMRNTYKYIYPE
ncbi:MAG: GerMN domain-containing protein [Oscillospiraceae bacterium]|nr:GerMN domain-containing protein [Oscillospiraceae bacterium]